MKPPQLLQTLVTAILLGGAPMPLLAQGPLNPPGPPAPMMKTLVEMEPRTHIVALPYTITASGSYYLTTNLNGGGTATGLVIQASNVTIDLRGFSIENCTSGISASGSGLTGVAIHNGSVRGCTGTGIDLATVSKVRLEDVMVSDNGGNGASVGGASLVTLCTAKGNAAQGLVLGDGGKVFQCVAQSNGSNGIVVTANCQASENNCNNNGAGAGLLTTGNSNRVEANSSNQNQNGFLINGTDNIIIRNNACGNTVAHYSVSAGNNYGQILVSPGAAFANSNPWANFGCGAPSNGSCAMDSDCNDNNACTTDSCQGGACVYTPIAGCGSACSSNADCNDGNACTQSDVCIAGSCSGGSPVVCDDGNACTSDSCNAVVGCVFTAIAGCGAAVCGDGIVQAGEACDDGNLVNGDGCSASCTVQTGYVCTGSPSVCTPITYPLNLSKAGSGMGTVSSAPAGISCGATCSSNYSSGTVVSLSASPDSGSSFAGWSGACTGTGTCTVTLSSSRSVSATFAAN